MPRYLVETQSTTGADREEVLRLSAQRFPEVALEHCFAVGDQPDRRDVWVCRAASDTHVQRWARAGGLVLWTLRKIENDAVHSAARGGQPA